jgi:hypothetical protein
MLDSVAVALSPGGYYVLVSYGPPKERLPWISAAERGWQVETWTLPKPSAEKLPGSDGWEPPRATRYAPERDIAGTVHYIYVVRRVEADALRRDTPPLAR